MDLTARASSGLIDPVIGREREVRRIVQILCRRTKSNPILLGEAGVGKTAIAEGLAINIAEGNVPFFLMVGFLFRVEKCSLLTFETNHSFALKRVDFKNIFFFFGRISVFYPWI